MKRIDLTAYNIRVDATADTTLIRASVLDLPGCEAAAETAGAVRDSIEQAIRRHLEQHPDAPAHYLGEEPDVWRIAGL